MGHDSSVGIAAPYGLEVRRSNRGGGRDIRHPSRPALGPTQPPVQWVPRLFPEGKAAGGWRWPPTPSNAEVKGSVELNLYSLSGTLWPCLGSTLPWHFTCSVDTLISLVVHDVLFSYNQPLSSVFLCRRTDRQTWRNSHTLFAILRTHLKEFSSSIFFEFL